MARTDKRVSPVTTRCTWCLRVIVQGRWSAERRRKPGGTYTDVICRRCEAFYFGGKVSDGGRVVELK